MSAFKELRCWPQVQDGARLLRLTPAVGREFVWTAVVWFVDAFDQECAAPPLVERPLRRFNVTRTSTAGRPVPKQ